MIYTSGSTGRPKGVLVEHRNVVNLFFSEHNPRFGSVVSAPRGTRFPVLATMSFAFEASWEPHLAMLSGLEMHVVGDEVRSDPTALVRYAADKDIVAVFATPSYFEQLMAAGLTDSHHHTPTTLVLGGEAINEPCGAPAEHTVADYLQRIRPDRNDGEGHRRGPVEQRPADDRSAARRPCGY